MAEGRHARVDVVCCRVNELRQLAMAFISVTRLRIRSVFYLPQFVWYAIQSQRQAQYAPGLIAGEVVRDVRNAFWTMTMWENERAMEVFRVQGAHRGAMPKLLDWCDEASLVHWTQESCELPTWQEAYERQERKAVEGKASLGGSLGTPVSASSARLPHKTVPATRGAHRVSSTGRPAQGRAN
jgi:Domain of unknown function (DUF3291)